MKRNLAALWHETDGVLSFEWTMVLTLLTIGIVAGLAAARDGIIDELSDVSGMLLSLDQSFRFEGILCIPDSVYEDAPAEVVDCGRSNLPGQPAVSDVDS